MTQELLKIQKQEADKALEKKSAEVVQFSGVSSHFHQLLKTAGKLDEEQFQMMIELQGAFSTQVKEFEAVISKQRDIIDQLQLE